MKQLLCVVFALVVALALAACTTGGSDVTTLATTTSTTSLMTTTSPSQGGHSTTVVPTTTTTEQPMTDGSDVVTTTAVLSTTTTTAQMVTLPGGVVTYSKHPNVPDFGAMLGIDYDMYKNDVYYYRVDRVNQADPQNNNGSRYMELLQDCGYVALAPYDKDGIQGYLYGNSTNGLMVLFAAARQQGCIVVAISQQ